MPDPSSQASADLTSASTEPESNTPSSASPTRGDEPCSPPIGPEFPSTTTYETFAWMPYRTLEKDGTVSSGFAQRSVIDALHQPTGNKEPLISYAEGSPAKTSPSPDNAADSPGNAPGSSTSSPESLSLFDPDGFSSRTYPDCSPAMAVGTSESCLERWPTSGTAWHGGFSTHVSSECRSDDAGCSSSEPSLTEILEPPQNVPVKYSLSARAANGILRRAAKRGRELPAHLKAALEAVT